MVVIEAKELKWYSGIDEFVRERKMEERFKKIYGVPLKDWEFEESDEEVISELLKPEPETYLVEGFEEYDAIAVWNFGKKPSVIWE